MWYSLLNLQQNGSGAIVAQVVFDDTSPWFDGHFLDNPVLPGIAQVKVVADMIARSTGQNLSIKRLNRIKFKKIVRPGERLTIEITPAAMINQYSFHITNQAQDICSGTMTLADTQH